MDLSKIGDLRSMFPNANNNVDDKIGYNLDEKKEFGIVRDTLLKYGLPTNNFDRNLKSLIIKKGDKTSGTGAYDRAKNTVKNVSEGYDLIHELFHMSSNGIKSIGSKLEFEEKVLNFKKGEIIGTSLDEGIVDLFTYLSSNGEYIKRYPIESLFALTLSDIYGKEIFTKHFAANTKELYKLFGEDISEIMEAISCLDVFTNEKIRLASIITKINLGFSMGKGPEDRFDSTKMFNSLIDFVYIFVDLISDKEKFILELLDLFNENTETINVLKNLAERSTYGSIDEVIKAIREVKDDYDFNL